MTIFDLIFDNVFFIIIVLGLISSLLSKLKKESADRQSARRSAPGIIFEDPFYYPNPDQKRKPYEYADHETRMDSYDDADDEEFDDEFDDEFDGDRYVYDDIMKKRSEPTPSPQPMMYSEPQQAVASQQQNLPVSHDESSPVYQQDKQGTLNPKPLQVNLLQGLPSNVVQGMMWAEIFGPPRAKRPYRGGPFRY